MRKDEQSKQEEMKNTDSHWERILNEKRISVQYMSFGKCKIPLGIKQDYVESIWFLSKIDPSYVRSNDFDKNEEDKSMKELKIRYLLVSSFSYVHVGI